MKKRFAVTTMNSEREGHTDVFCLISTADRHAREQQEREDAIRILIYEIGYHMGDADTVEIDSSKLLASWEKTDKGWRFSAPGKSWTRTWGQDI